MMKNLTCDYINLLENYKYVLNNSALKKQLMAFLYVDCMRPTYLFFHWSVNVCCSSFIGHGTPLRHLKHLPHLIRIHVTRYPWDCELASVDLASVTSTPTDWAKN